MSAIFGLVYLDGRPISGPELTLMRQALVLHGPDGQDTWQTGSIGLGQCLRRIASDDPGGKMPETGSLVTPSDSPVLMSDARLDNRPELAECLGIPAAHCWQISSRAFILRAYEKWGVDCPGHLSGTFIFALYDPVRRRLLLARSPGGEKTLFYYQSTGMLAFASAPRGLFALRRVPRKVDRQTIADYLVMAPDEPGSSFYEDVYQLEPGHSIVIEGRTPEFKRFWNPDRRGIRFARDSEYVDSFNALFERVTADYLRGASSVAVMMSGGLDSSSVAAVAATHLACEGRRLLSYTAIPPAGFAGPLDAGKYADETPFVQAMASRYPNLDIEFVRPDGSFFLDDIDSFFEAAEAPFRNPLNRGWWESIVARAAAAKVPRVLTGSAGNLTVSWGGSAQLLLRNLIASRQWRRLWLESSAIASHRAPATSAINVLLRQVLLELPRPCFAAAQKIRFLGTEKVYAARPWRAFSPIRPEFAARQHVQPRAREKGYDFHRGFDDASPSRRIGGFRSAEISRAHEALFGVESLDPTADIRILEFCLSLPEEQYLHRGISRSLIRRAMADRLPPCILNNHRRGAQSPDWLDQMRAHKSRMLRELESVEASPLVREAIDLPRLRLLVNRIDSAPAATVQTRMSYRNVLASGLMVSRFLAWCEKNV